MSSIERRKDNKGTDKKTVASTLIGRGYCFIFGIG